MVDCRIAEADCRRTRCQIGLPGGAAPGASCETDRTSNCGRYGGDIAKGEWETHLFCLRLAVQCLSSSASDGGICDFDVAIQVKSQI